MNSLQRTEIQCLKASSSPWMSPYDGGKVRVYIGLARPSDEAYFVGVCDSDDEYWHSGESSLLEASLLYIRVTSQDDVTKELLTTLGFQ